MKWRVYSKGTDAAQILAEAKPSGPRRTGPALGRGRTPRGPWNYWGADPEACLSTHAPAVTLKCPVHGGVRSPAAPSWQITRTY